MGNVATPVSEQIALLGKRGMVMDLEVNEVKKYLLDIGYYRLGFYWHPFVIDDLHNFAVGTKFSDVIKLYYLDVDLRNILTKYLNRIEVNFRTKVVYYVSNKYKINPFWFIDKKIINQSFIDEFGKYYSEEFKRSNKPIKKHHQNYLNDRYAPAWKTLEFFTFGVILKIFRNLQDPEIKERISNIYGVKNISKFISFIETVVLLRNICAHCAVLFDFQTPKGISVIPEINFNSRDRHSLDSSIKVVLFLLSKISVSRKEDMEKDIVDLFNRHRENSVIKNIIESKINYIYKDII